MKKFFYRVQEGDSVLSVSERFGTPVIKIISLNNLSREVETGDMILLEEDGGGTYTVQPNDSLECILEKFHICESEFIEKNGKVDYVFYGLKIKI